MPYSLFGLLLLLFACGDGGDMGDTDLFQESLAAIKGRSWQGKCNVVIYVGEDVSYTGWSKVNGANCTIHLYEYEGGGYGVEAQWTEGGEVKSDRLELSELQVVKSPRHLSKKIEAKYGDKRSFTLYIPDDKGELTDQFYLHFSSVNGLDDFYVYLDTYPEKLSLLKDKLFNDEHGPLGCLDEDACNFDSNAKIDNGDCDYPGEPCDDGISTTYFDVVSECDKCQGLPIASIDGPCQGTQFLNFDFERWGISGSFNSPLIEFDNRCVTLKPFLPPYNQKGKQVFKILSREHRGDGPLDEFEFNTTEHYAFSWEANFADLLTPGWKPIIVNESNLREHDFTIRRHLKEKLGYALPEHPDYAHGSTWPVVDSTEKTYHLEFVGNFGCVDPEACNFDPQAIDNDGSCLYTGDPCDDQNASTIGDYIDSNCECAYIKNTLVEADASGPCAGLTKYDFNGHEYSLVEIGSECIFNESLRQPTFTNGSPLVQIGDALDELSVSNAVLYQGQGLPQKSNEPQFYIDSLGVYRYNSKAIILGRQQNCLCPEGWNVPSHLPYLTTGGDNPELALRGTSIDELSILWADLGFAQSGGIPYISLSYRGDEVNVYKAQKRMREQPLRKIEGKYYRLPREKATYLTRRVKVRDFHTYPVFYQIICVKNSKDSQ